MRNVSRVRQPHWTTVAVLGVGAVGGYFGAMLAKGGARVKVIGRPAQVEAIREHGLVVAQGSGEWRARVDASADVADAADADLVLLAVKSRDTETAAAPLRASLRAHVPVVSLQNGVDNAQRIASVVPNPVYAAVVYLGAEAEAAGRVRHTGGGELVIGLPRKVPARGDAAKDLSAIARLFAGAGVPCPVSDDIDAALWTKLAINCACNPVSALAHARYGAMVAHAPTRELMERIVRETAAIGMADGVRLDAEKLLEALWKVTAAMPEQRSSTAQDLLRRKPTEIDALNGFVVRRAEALGAEAPINRTLHALVTARELAGRD